MICPKCKKEMKGSPKFCGFCGNVLSKRKAIDTNKEKRSDKSSAISDYNEKQYNKTELSSIQKINKERHKQIMNALDDIWNGEPFLEAFNLLYQIHQ